MDCDRIIFSAHAIQKMFFRRISPDDVKSVIAYGEVIEENLEDQPFPSYLLFDFAKGVPLHVVVSQDLKNALCVVVTTYVPSCELWSDDFRSRR